MTEETPPIQVIIALVLLALVLKGILGAFQILRKVNSFLETRTGLWS